VVVPAAAVTATIIGETGGCYAFSCPTCHLREGRPATTRVLKLLAETCAALRSIPDPGQIEIRPQVGPLTMREVAAASASIADDEWFDGAVAALRDGALDL